MGQNREAGPRVGRLLPGPTSPARAAGLRAASPPRHPPASLAGGPPLWRPPSQQVGVSPSRCLTDPPAPFPPSRTYDSLGHSRITWEGLRSHRLHPSLPLHGPPFAMRPPQRLPCAGTGGQAPPGSVHMDWDLTADTQQPGRHWEDVPGEGWQVSGPGSGRARPAWGRRRRGCGPGARCPPALRKGQSEPFKILSTRMT